MDTFLTTTTLEPRPGVMRKNPAPKRTTETPAPLDHEFFSVLRGELVNALRSYPEAYEAASQAFKRVFARFGID